jgi:histidyl-tRNA synthetase
MIKFFNHFATSKMVKFDPLLARGMDYYTGLIYEVVFHDKTVMPSTIAAGGRYDKVLGKFCNKGDMPAIGLSVGVERIVTIWEHYKVKITVPTVDIYVASVGTLDATERMKICVMLREAGFSVETSYQENPKMRQQLNHVFEKNIPYLCVVGEDELKNNSVKIKDIKNKIQYDVQIADIVGFIKGLQTNNLNEEI